MHPGASRAGRSFREVLNSAASREEWEEWEEGKADITFTSLAKNDLHGAFQRAARAFSLELEPLAHF